MPILVELPRICLSSLVNVCFPKCVDSHMHVRFARPSFASDIDNLSVTAVRFVTGTEWNHVRRVRRHVRRVRPLVRSSPPSLVTILAYMFTWKSSELRHDVLMFNIAVVNSDGS